MTGLNKTEYDLLVMFYRGTILMAECPKTEYTPSPGEQVRMLISGVFSAKQN